MPTPLFDDWTVRCSRRDGHGKDVFTSYETEPPSETVINHLVLVGGQFYSW